MSRFKKTGQDFLTRRAAILGGGMTLLSSALLGRMYYLQVVNGKEYELLANENRISYRIISPQRGEIRDRFERPIAVNKVDYRVNIIPDQCDDVEKTLQSVSKIIALTNRQKRRIRRQFKSQRSYLPVNIAQNLSWNKFAEINVHLPSLAGVHPEVGTVRYYPLNKHIAHLVGYVASISKNDMDGDPLLLVPGFKIGKDGLERTLEKKLRGKAGNRKVEVNSIGREIREISRKNSQSGDLVNLTIDVDIQAYVSERIKHESAAVVVMDIHTGEILSIVSTPAFDPNDFNGGISHKKWNALRIDKRKPLLNKTVAGQYSPGSTFKMVVALAALKAGVITEDTTSVCTGKHEVGNQIFHCWRKRGHGQVNLVQALSRSCDVFFYEAAIKTGIDKIHDMAEKLGIGVKFNIHIPGELRGINPSTSWKKAVMGSSWRGGDSANAGIGQGFVLTTPLQLCVMISRLVNGGRGVLPKILMDDAETSKEAPELNIPEHHLKLILQGMNDVMNDPRGTAYRYRIKDKNIAMGGKTGTTQVRRISLAERKKGIIKTTDRPWEHREHALFVGFAPVDHPRYALSVLVEHGGGGASTASPIGRDILKYTMSRDPLLSQNITFDSQKRTFQKKTVKNKHKIKKKGL